MSGEAARRLARAGARSCRPPPLPWAPALPARTRRPDSALDGTCVGRACRARGVGGGEPGKRGAVMAALVLLSLHPRPGAAFCLGSLFPHPRCRALHTSGGRLASSSSPAWARVRGGGGVGSGASGASGLKSLMLIPAGTAEAEIKVKNSRFIGVAGYTPTTDKAREFIASVKEKYPDARHHCYAFVVGHGASVNSGMGDDGEPSGTAGRPMLSVLTGGGSELGDCCVVVVRYFGGTKLGTGGLVKAYTEATQVALLALQLTQKLDMVRIRVAKLGYDHYAKVRGPLEGLGCSIEDEAFGEGVDITLVAEESKAEQVTSLIRDASSGQAEVSQPERVEP